MISASILVFVVALISFTHGRRYQAQRDALWLATISGGVNKGTQIGHAVHVASRMLDERIRKRDLP